jgi:hypothetical protein
MRTPIDLHGKIVKSEKLKINRGMELASFEMLS